MTRKSPTSATIENSPAQNIRSERSASGEHLRRMTEVVVRKRGKMIHTKEKH